jgi:hypothetical protein
MLTNKQKLKLAKLEHRKWLESLGVCFDRKGNVINNFQGYETPEYKPRDSIKTSDRIVNFTGKRNYATELPEGKTISVAYNKGPYMVVDAKDFKTMGRKI